MTKANLTEMV